MEIEDIDALIAQAGGPVHLYGVSSGGALALEAAAAGVAVDRLAVYEVPYNVAAGWPRRWREYTDTSTALLAGGRRGDAGFALFMRLADIPAADIEAARDAPFWPELEAIAHTLAYDAACLGDGAPPVDRLAAITRPTPRRHRQRPAPARRCGLGSRPRTRGGGDRRERPARPARHDRRIGLRRSPEGGRGDSRGVSA